MNDDFIFVLREGDHLIAAANEINDLIEEADKHDYKQLCLDSLTTLSLVIEEVKWVETEYEYQIWKVREWKGGKLLGTWLFWRRETAEAFLEESWPEALKIKHNETGTLATYREDIVIEIISQTIR